MIAPNGGCGVSTLATNLAVSLAQQHERVLLVDLHLYTDDLASLLDLKPTYSIANLCQSVSGIDSSLFDRALTPHESGVELLAPPRRIEDAASGDAPRGVPGTCVWLVRPFPFVVVDVDVESGETMLEVLIQSDLILLVIKPDVISLRNAKRLLDRLEWLGISSLSIRTVLIRVGQPGEVPIAKVEAALRSKVFHVIPEDLKVVNSCNNMGVPCDERGAQIEIRLGRQHLGVGNPQGARHGPRTGPDDPRGQGRGGQHGNHDRGVAGHAGSHPGRARRDHEPDTDIDEM